MKRSYYIIAIFVVMFVYHSFAFADRVEEQFARGNQAYSAGKFEEAIQSYKGILAQGFENSDLYFNLGNCYFRLARIGEAVLYYEKARKLNPHDLDIRYNLELANLQVVDRLEMPARFFLFEWWDDLKIYYSLHQLSNLVMILFATTILLLIFWLFVRIPVFRRILFTGVTAAGFLFLFFSYILFARIQEQNSIRSAIILAPTVTVLSAPDENSSDVFLLHQGSKVFLDDQRTEWVKISLPDGKSGWIKSNVFGII